MKESYLERQPNHNLEIICVGHNQFSGKRLFSECNQEISKHISGLAQHGVGSPWRVGIKGEMAQWADHGSTVVCRHDDGRCEIIKLTPPRDYTGSGPSPIEALPVATEPPAPVDMLRAIFLRQAAFRRRVSDKHDSLSPRDWADLEIFGSLADHNVPTVEEGVKKYALCLLMEASELMDWTRWKHWSSRLGNKKDVSPGGAEHIREMRMECADLLCFLVNTCIELGMGPDDLNSFHAEKVGINHQRQETGTY